MSLKSVLTVIFCLFLVGCSTQPKTESVDFPKWALPFEKVEVVQLLKGDYAQKQFVFQVGLSMKEDGLSLIALDSMGRRAFSVFWDDNGVTAQKANWMPDMVRAEYILKDIMMAYWPIDALGVFDESVRQVGNERIVENNGDKTLSIYSPSQMDRWNGKVVIENHVLGYRIEIQSKRMKGAS
ncbi:DUF3261 domain-containing protein [Terasakiella sp. A23]|uniref:DUF3261 domain-containing protein n=1 Tax=Terasakiella sp. FCG-A23 TaxID=3080561 RepID=UPI002953C39D|nr:DUF3261 domain-containing protein [Terasakiella sp. A23]MDV7341032.1 DUF3261 domain-containing protein [Terasakiella sp. A23]